MSHPDHLVKERLQFLQQPADKLRQLRGAGLYDTLNQLGLTHAHVLRALGTNLDDYCAQEFGIDVRNITVERFFGSDPNAKWLFPDIVRDAVLTGMRRKPVYPELIAGDAHINSVAYDLPYVIEDDAEDEMRQVAEGAAIPESEIAYGNRVVRLEKFGRGILASYEVVRRMSIDMLRVHLNRIGERLGRALDEELAFVLVNGDASGAGTAPEIVNTATANTWTYDDILKGFLKLSLDNYFTPTHLLADAATSAKLLRLAEFSDSTRADFSKTGQLPTPLGMKFVPMTDHPANHVTIMDAGFAVQKLTEQDLLIESDKLINQQWERTYLSIVTDFAVLYEKARIVLKSDWT